MRGGSNIKVETIRFIETVAASSNDGELEELFNVGRNVHLNQALENYQGPKL